MQTILIDLAPAAGGAWAQVLAANPMPCLSRRLRLAEVSGQEPLREDADAAWLTPAERWMQATLGLAPSSQGSAGPPQVSLPPSGGGLGAARPWGCSEGSAGPPQVSLPPPGGGLGAARPWGCSEQMPWGALAALGAGADLHDLPWGLALPAHLELGRESLSLANPATLQLKPAEAQSLLEAVQPLLVEAGWQIDASNPQRWLIAHPSLAEVVTADPARAIARNVAAWMPAGTPARPWRQLLTEMQMVWQYHPVNEARMRAGLPETNTLWLHGCGRLPADLRNPFVLQVNAQAQENGQTHDQAGGRTQDRTHDQARSSAPDTAPAFATAWWRAAQAGLPRLPSSRHPHPLHVLHPQATREADAAQLAVAIAALDQAAAEAIDLALRQHASAQVVLAGERRWLAFELHKSRRWQFWRRADAHVLLGLV